MVWVGKFSDDFRPEQYLNNKTATIHTGIQINPNHHQN